jgi:hypothetical protein
MNDLHFHLVFARRLRFAEGVHPLVVEAMSRRGTFVAMGAAMPLLPQCERNTLSFWGKLFSRGALAGRWQKAMHRPPPARVEYARSMIDLAAGVDATKQLGPMARFALGLGALSHELVATHVGAHIAKTGVSDRLGADRAYARLWLGATLTSARALRDEWTAALSMEGGLQRPDHQRSLEHVHQAIGRLTQQPGPGKEALTRWIRALPSALKSAVDDGLPASLATSDQAVRQDYEQHFVEVVQDVVRRFVGLSGAVADRLTQGATLDGNLIDELWSDGAGLRDVAAPSMEAATRWQRALRRELLERGRNDAPAFVEGAGVQKHIERSSAFTGVMQLSELGVSADGLPPALPPALPASLPPVAAGLSAPPLPAMTQEVSLASLAHIEALVPLQTPAMTQEVSLAQIEVSTSQFTAPPMTMEISATDIQSAVESVSDDDKPT